MKALIVYFSRAGENIVGDEREIIEKGFTEIVAEKGMSGAELSRLISLSTGVYSQWNTGKQKPSNRTLKKIAEVLDVDISALLADGEKMKKTSPSKMEDEVYEKYEIELITALRELPKSQRVNAANSVISLLRGLSYPDVDEEEK